MTVLESALETARDAIAVAVAPVKVELDEPEPEMVDAAGYIAIQTGEPVDVEVLFGQGLESRHYSWIHGSLIVVYCADVDGRREKLNALHEQIAGALDANPTLSGIVDRAQLGGPTTFHTLEPTDGTPLGILSLPLTLEYQSTSSAG